MDIPIEQLQILDAEVCEGNLTWSILEKMGDPAIGEYLENLLTKPQTQLHLTNILTLLKYQCEICLQKSTEINNRKLFDYAIKSLFPNINNGNIYIVSDILRFILLLQPSTSASKSEHFIQQILTKELIDDNTKESNEKLLFHLILVDGILKAALEGPMYLDLQYYFASLEKIAFHSDSNIQKYFLIDIVPKFIQVVGGYDILARIWEYMGKSKDIYTNLKTLNYLSDYFIPTDETFYLFDLVREPQFWKIIIDALYTHESINKKLCIGLLKSIVKACCLTNERFEVILDGDLVFHWDKRDEQEIVEVWKNYFMLIETLDEKQSNIVFPCLNVFKTIVKGNIAKAWYNYAFQLGLNHSNFLVCTETLQLRLQYPITDFHEATMILTAVNDERIYRTPKLVTYIMDSLSKGCNIKFIFPKLSSISWLATPLYYMTKMLAKAPSEALHSLKPFDSNILSEIASLPCNVIPIRLAVKHNLLEFLCKTYMDWRNFFSTLAKLNVDIEEKTPGFKEIEKVVSEMIIIEEEKVSLVKYLFNVKFHNVVKIYLKACPQDNKYFINILKEKLHNAETDVFDVDDLAFMANFLRKGIETDGSKEMKELIKDNFNCIARDLRCLVMEREVGVANFYENFQSICNNFMKEFGVHELLKDIPWNENIDVEFKIRHLILIKSIIEVKGNFDVNKLPFLLDCKQYTKKGGKDCKNGYNNMYECACEIIYLLLPLDVEEKKFIEDLTKFLEHAVECGGYGCLKWILKAVVSLVDSERKYGVSYLDYTTFDIVKFIDVSWTEVLALKSNKQFVPCMREFVNLITLGGLERNENYNLIVPYGMEVLRLMTTSMGPVSLLAMSFEDITLCTDSPWLQTFVELLLYRPVLTEDQRHQNMLIQSLPEYFRNNEAMREEPIFPNELRNASGALLPAVKDDEALGFIAKQLLQYMTKSLKAKPRYYQNSLTHQIYIQILMHTVFIMKLTSKCEDLYLHVSKCCIEIFAYSHQKDVRFYLEWLLTLCILKLHKTLPTDIFTSDSGLVKVPEISRLFISYFYITRRQNMDDLKVILNHVLPFTMGPNFTLRLLAQYLIRQMANLFGNIDNLSATLNTISQVLDSMVDNAYYKDLKNSILIHKFDPVNCLKAEMIYCKIPKLFTSDLITDKYLIPQLELDRLINEFDRFDIDMEINVDINWIDDCIHEDEEAYEFMKFIKSLKSNEELMLAYQKKYIPGEDAGLEEIEKNELIVVASLVDKLPNLGGMARTCEVFGVKNLVVHSLKQIASKEFQGTSMSAEKLVDIKEVPLGPTLIEYLKSMRTNGYTVVAAEQTSISVNLNTYTFPKKTILITGHEKEGLPPNLFPFVDAFVRIPQLGYTRSLNVHVTASIFIWEYVKQHTEGIET